MLGMLAGDKESAEAVRAATGKTIKGVSLADDVLRFEFTDGTGIGIADEGQSCCEHRYITTDDDLSQYAGAQFLGGAVEDGPSVSGEFDEHDTAFLRIQTSCGVLTAVTHVEHNGYYGGFYVRVTGGAS